MKLIPIVGLVALASLSLTACDSQASPVPTTFGKVAHAVDDAAPNANEFAASLAASVAQQNGDALGATATVLPSTTATSAAFITTSRQGAAADAIDDNLSPAASQDVSDETDALDAENSGMAADDVDVTAVHVRVDSVTSRPGDDNTTDITTRLYVARTVANGPVWEEMDNYVASVDNASGEILSLTQPDVPSDDGSSDGPAAPAAHQAQAATYIRRTDSTPGATSDTSPDSLPGGGGGSAGLSASGKAKVAAYADKYWSNYNTSGYPAYPQYGDDCTDFVSQALHAGGWKEDAVTTTYNDGHHWWYQGNLEYSNHYYSQSWTSATQWKIFATWSGRVAKTSSSGAVVGDIVQYDVSEDGDMNHSMIVTSISGDAPNLTYHSNDTHNKPLSAVKSLTESQNPGQKIGWYYWMT